VVVILAAVLSVLWGATLLWLSHVAAQGRQQALMHSARTIMSAAEAQIEHFITAGRVLAESPALLNDDIPAFEAQARRSVAALGDAWIILGRPDGEQLFNTRMETGPAGPLQSPTAHAAVRRAIAAGRMQMSDVFIGTTLQKPIMSITLPVARDGVPRYVLVIVFSPHVFDPLLNGLPDNWLAGIVDSKGNFITRSVDNDVVVGQPASEGWRATMHTTGISEFPSRDGEMLVNANMPSRHLGWAAAVGVRTAALYFPLWTTLSVAALLGAAAIGVCLAVLAGIGRRIAAMLDALKRAVTDLRRQKPTLERSGDPDIDPLIEAFNVTAADLAAIERERAQHDRQMKLAAAELNHRSKNLLTVVMGMARLIGRDARDLMNFNERFNARLQALARCQDLLIENDWKQASLAEVVRSQIEPFAMGRVDVTGEPVMLATETIQPFSLLLHELATNAAKYGALSIADGRVALSWSVARGAAGEPTLSLTWRESGGPAARTPDRRGFGTTVIQETCVHSLGGSVTLDFRPDGLVCTCAIPLGAAGAVRARPGAAPAAEPTSAARELVAD